MPQTKYDEAFKADYVAKRRTGLGNLEVCRELGINHKTGDAWWADHRRKEARSGFLSANPPKRLDRIKRQRAYNDFVHFRLLVFGRKTPPWARKAVEVMRAAVEEAYTRDRREYFLINLFPGAGKTVLLQDFCCWLIARNRDIRLIWGGASDEQATTRTRQIRAELMRVEPWEGDEEEIKSGRAVKPRFCMVDLFGRFRPATHQGIAWKDGEFTVCKPGKDRGSGEGPPPVGPTMLAAGPRTRQLGRRANFIVWDDLWSEAENDNPDLGAKVKRFYDKTATSRLQPNGTLALLMQRLGPADLSRHVLDKRRRARDPATGDDLGYEPTYRHIIFPAHHDELCNGRHPTGAPAWDPDDPACRHDTRCGHCLTDPKALSPDDYLTFCETPDWPVVYQQRDVGTAGAIFPEVWLTGGKDENGQQFKGCLDFDRGLWELPADLPRTRLASAMAIDVGVTKYWGLYASVHSTEKDVEAEWILAADHRIMPAGTEKGLIDYDWSKRAFVGVMEDWYQMSKDIGVPFTHVVAEINCAQRHLFRGNNNIEQWQLSRNVRIIAHETTRNKNDKKLGVTGLMPMRYQLGAVRFPWRPGVTQDMMRTLYQEIIGYGQGGATTDVLMTAWMRTLNRRRIERAVAPVESEKPSRDIPAWIQQMGRSIG